MIDFIVFIHRLGPGHWENHIELSQATPQQKEEANLRSQYPWELCIDIENKDPAIIRRACETLERMGIRTYVVWLTGGRGVHIDAMIEELGSLDPQQRSRARAAIIKEVGADPATASDLHKIGIELKPHRNTGVPKTILFKKDGGPNELPMFAVLAAVSVNAAAQEKKTTIIHSKEELLNNPLVVYCLRFPLPPEIGRYGSPCKNLGILIARAVICKVITDQEASDLIARLEANIKRGYIHNWYISAKNQPDRYSYFNGWESAKWLEENEDVLA